MLRYSLPAVFGLLLGTLVLFPIEASHAQGAVEETPSTVTAASEAPGIVLLVRRPQHIRAALQTVRDLRASDSLSTTPTEIVVCGKAVRDIQADDPLADSIAQMSSPTVQVLACGMSLNNLGVAPNALPSEVRVVPNGLAHALKRQAAGYLSIEL